MSDPSLLQLRDCVVDLRVGQVLRGQRREQLTGRELSLLKHLAENAGRTVPQAELLEEVFGYRPGARTRVVSSTLRRLRVKLGEDPAAPEHIVTVYGEGVRFEGARPAAPLTQAPSLLGRAQELATLLQCDARLVVITGCGGVGKTRLARALLEMEAGTFVPLSAAGGVEAARGALAKSLGMFESAGPEALAKRLRALPPGWVVLDNVEQLIGALEPALSRWMAAAPQLRWLLTSRRRPSLDHLGLALEPLGPASARALFRARLGEPGEGEDFDRVYRLTQGIPLALELAAGRARLLAGASVGQHLEDQGLATLGSSGRGRHASVVAAVRGSVALLAPAEAEDLARLACFPEGFTLEAASALLGPGGLLRLDQLRDASLLCVRPEDGRLQLYVTVREVVAAEASADSRRAFLGWAASLAARELPLLRSPRVGEALGRLEREWPALLTALRFAELDPSAAVTLLEGVAEAARLTSRRLPPLDAVEALESLRVPPALTARAAVAFAALHFAAQRPARGLAWVPDPASAPPEQRLAAWDLRLLLLYDTGQHETVRVEGPVAVEQARAQGDGAMEGRLRYRLAVASPAGGRAAQAVTAMTLLEAAGDHAALAAVMSGWGKILAMDERRPRAGARVLERGVALLRSLPPSRLYVHVRLVEAQALLDAGDWAAAVERCLALQEDAERWGIPSRVDIARSLLGGALLDGGQIEESVEVLGEVLPRALQAGWHQALSVSWRLALGCVLLGDVDRVIELVAHLLRVTAPLPPELRAPAPSLISGLAAAGGDLQLAEEAIEAADALARERTRYGRSLFRVPLLRARLRAGEGDAAQWRDALRARQAELEAPGPEGSPLDCDYDLRTVAMAVEALALPTRGLQAAIASQLPTLRALFSSWGGRPCDT